MTILEQKLLYLCRRKGRTFAYLMRRMRLDFNTLQALIKHSEKYVDVEPHDDLLKCKCLTNLEGKLAASNYAERLFGLYYPLVVSTLSIIISVISILLR